MDTWYDTATGGGGSERKSPARPLSTVIWTMPNVVKLAVRISVNAPAARSRVFVPAIGGGKSRCETSAPAVSPSQVGHVAAAKVTGSHWILNDGSGCGPTR